MIVFFFSSRRRHTRFKCDWSSDVCSSDLLELITGVLSLIGVASSTGIPRGLGQFGQIVVLIAALDFTILEILTVVGCVFAIFTPNKKGTLAFAITALSLSGVALIVKIIWFLVPYFNDGGQAYGLIQVFVGLADVADGF